MVLSDLLISDNNLFLSIFFFGKKPMNMKEEEGRPLDTNAVIAAHGPGMQITSNLFDFTFLIRSSPGSQILGIPASLTSATDF